jgi:putative transposase
MTQYSRGSHTTYHHRYHIVWITKYRYKVLRGALQLRVREIVAQVAEEFNVHIVNGVVSSDHVHIFVSIPPHVRESDLVKVMKRRSSRKVQQEFPELRKRYWGRHFWARGYFSVTSGNVTDEMIDEYINNHVDAHKHNDTENITLE